MSEQQKLNKQKALTQRVVLSDPFSSFLGCAARDFKVLVFFIQVNILFRMHAGWGQIILPLGSLFHA